MGGEENHGKKYAKNQGRDSSFHVTLSDSVLAGYAILALPSNGRRKEILKGFIGRAVEKTMNPPKICKPRNLGSSRHGDRRGAPY
jgi:hypothetical protein